MALCLAGVTLAQTVSKPLPPKGLARYPFHIRNFSSNDAPAGLSPEAVRHFYGFDRVNLTGAHQVIAIIDWYDDPSIEQDLAAFSAQYGLPACTAVNGCFRKLFATGSQPRSDGDASMEIALDVEWAHAIAPNAQIVLVEAANPNFESISDAISLALQVGATVVSMSFGGDEYSEEIMFDQIFRTPNVTFIASSGDYGAGVEYPAASPYVLSVGGTTGLTNMQGRRLGEIAWSGSGGGVSEYETALDVPAGNLQIKGQHARSVPDVAYLGDPLTGMAVYSSVAVDGHSGWFGVGGTSAGAPQWAGLIAIVNEGRTVLGKNVIGAGAPGATLAAIYREGAYGFGGNFNDIVQGASGLCGTQCMANAGYDLLTGLGTPIADKLIQALIALP